MMPLLIGGGVLLIIIIWFISINNRLVSLKNNRENAFADIDVQLKQRNDLIPQLVGAVKGYMNHESEVLTRVTEARSKSMQAGTIPEKIAAEGMMASAMAGFRMQIEAYPDLKANENFLELQRELSDTENKIQASRRFYNSVVLSLNTKVESFPDTIIANMFGFTKKDYFEVTEAEKEVVKVSF
jgi:LemA protein